MICHMNLLTIFLWVFDSKGQEVQEEAIHILGITGFFLQSSSFVLNFFGNFYKFQLVVKFNVCIFVVANLADLPLFVNKWTRF